MAQKFKESKGFTLIELLVALAIFGVLVAGTVGALAAVSRLAKTAREKTALASLAVNYLEIVRNMPYSQVGTLSGNPHGTLPDFPSALTQTVNASVYKIYYDVNYIHDPSDSGGPGSPSYKQVKMYIVNNVTGQATTFITTVAPSSVIANPNTAGLQVNVINAQGQPVQGASVEIRYPTTTPYTYDLFDTTDASGQVLEVGLPAAVNSYRIIATKAGYSTDNTLPITAQNPNPVHPDATLVNGLVTTLTLSIDFLANLNIKTLNEFCQNVNGINLNVAGAKLIGTNPNVYKFNNNYTSSNGLVALNNIEWDTYTPTLLSGQSWIIRGTSPIQKIDVLPGTTQTFTMILGSNSTANSLLVVVKDGSSGAALEGATVELQKGGSQPQDYTQTTGGSVWVQSDWSGGAGQAQWSTSTPSLYFQDDGNVDSNSSPTGLRLKKTSGHYALSGWLESSTFDTGTNATNYTILTWQPASQSASTNLQFQIAANNDNATWNYLGPDGTSATYFTTPGTDMGSAFDNKRYVRYKVFLSTSDNSKTPVLTSLNVNFVTGCFTPGQVSFADLTAGNNYSLTVSMPGYQTQVINSLDINGNQNLEILMSPQ